MTNELSEDLNQYFEDSDIQFQLVPSHTNQRYAAERDTRTFKNHVIASLYTVDPIFPLYLCGSIWTQVTIILNMLQRYKLNPELSDYEQVYSIHHF